MHRPGLYTAIITPFSPDGREIDIAAFRTLVKRQIDGGVQGIVVVGTTGELPTVSPGERELLIREAKDISQGKILIMAGCGSSCTRTTIEQARATERMGADALQISPPAYNRPSQEGIFSHFSAIHDAISIPLFVYNIPSRTGVNIEPKTVERLLKLERCVGLKEASGNLLQLMDIMEIVSALKKPVTILSGDDLLALPSIVLGAHGVMSVIGNLLPKETNALIMNALEGKEQKASKALYSLKKLMQTCFLDANPVPIKYMLSKYGLAHERCRLPLTPLSFQNKESIDALLKSTNFKEL